MSYKVVQVNGINGPKEISDNMAGGYALVGGVSAAFHPSENKMKYFQGMYKPADSYYRNIIPLTGGLDSSPPVPQAAPVAQGKSSAQPSIGISFKGGRRTRRMR